MKLLHLRYATSLEITRYMQITAQPMNPSTKPCSYLVPAPTRLKELPGGGYVRAGGGEREGTCWVEVKREREIRCLQEVRGQWMLQRRTKPGGLLGPCQLEVTAHAFSSLTIQPSKGVAREVRVTVESRADILRWRIFL